MCSLRQPSLFELLKITDPHSNVATTDQLELYEYFAGAGGFSTGAAQAGCRVVYACDSCPLALETHRRNCPTAEHQCLKLPSREAAARLPTDGRRFHVHCSPPCVKFSQINAANVSNQGSKGKTGAVNMIQWSLEMMLASQCTSWSMEQVPSPEVVEMVERVRLAHPERVAWIRVDMSLLGVPQVRKRLIAGTPRLVARLKRLCSMARRRSVRATLPKLRGTHLHHGRSWATCRLRLNRKLGETKYVLTKAQWSDNCITVDKPGPTVRARHVPTWVTVVDGKAVDHSVMYPSELATLQTFPAGYKLPERKFDAYMQVGNAVPPLVARLLLEEEAASAPPVSHLRAPRHFGRVREMVRVRDWVRVEL